ncbi:MAG: Mur ligase domain-containing protein, partial [Patescibacteria group bacterium]
MKIYCSGIGGIGLSAYAALENANGHEVLGSDRSESEILKKLRDQGISVALNQDGTFIPNDIDLFVYSEAIPKDAPERRRAEALGIKMQSYFEALGELSQNNTVIAVCGTHGKSSTVAMAARVLIAAGKDPTIVAGTKLKELDKSNCRKGESDLFLLEACEYRRSFLALSPNIILMTNVDGDHFDAFDSVEDYQEAFVEFLKSLSMNGQVITHMEDADCERVSKESGKEIIDADEFPLPKLSVPGKHMQQNAQLVLGLAQALDIPQEKALKALSGYAGCWRRMEVKGEYGDGITVIDDYAH